MLMIWSGLQLTANRNKEIKVHKRLVTVQTKEISGKQYHISPFLED